MVHVSRGIQGANVAFRIICTAMDSKPIPKPSCPEGMLENRKLQRIANFLWHLFSTLWSSARNLWVEKTDWNYGGRYSLQNVMFLSFKKIRNDNKEKNKELVSESTVELNGKEIHSRTWQRVNRFRTCHVLFRVHIVQKWKFKDSSMCECGNGMFSEWHHASLKRPTLPVAHLSR